jgi:dCMP deaminase
MMDLRDDRVPWDKYFVHIAWAVAVRGDCRRSRVGAVLVDAKRVVVSTGYNGHEPRGKSCLKGECARGLKSYSELPPEGDYSDCEAIHAEDNAIRFARRTGQNRRFKGATMYITRKPCSGCMDLLRSERIARVVWPQGMEILGPWANTKLS